MSTPAGASIVLRCNDKLGTPLPSKLAAKLADATALLESSRALTSERTRAVLTDAVVAELRAGTDPLDSPAVARAALADQLGNAGIGAAVSIAHEREIASALTESADTILASWSKSLAPHGDNILTAAQELASDDLHDLAGIQRHPVAYSKAVDALRRFDAAITGAMQLATIAHVRRPDYVLFFLADPARLRDAKEHAQQRGDSRPSPWTVARLGITPTLIASLGELMERGTAYRQHRTEAARQTEHEHKEALTRSLRYR